MYAEHYINPSANEGKQEIDIIVDRIPGLTSLRNLPSVPPPEYKEVVAILDTLPWTDFIDNNRSTVMHYLVQIAPSTIQIGSIYNGVRYILNLADVICLYAQNQAPQTLIFPDGNNRTPLDIAIKTHNVVFIFAYARLALDDFSIAEVFHRPIGYKNGLPGTTPLEALTSDPSLVIVTN